jgi:uncharacterized membrane protein
MLPPVCQDRATVTKGRLEAFSDGVMAIIITIMVLELRPPESFTLSDLLPIWPKMIGYAVSFVFIGIYWSNHHHLMHSVKHVDGASLWANLALLFWLSLVPFVTAWVGSSHFQKDPVALYGVVLLLLAISYYILTRTLIRANGEESEVAKALGKDFKGKVSVAIYVAAILASLLDSRISCALYLFVALMWLVPDKRFENRNHVLNEPGPAGHL